MRYIEDKNFEYKDEMLKELRAYNLKHTGQKDLSVDTIDLLYLHVDDFETQQEEYMEALSKLIKKGYVKAIGCSNFLTWRIETARRILSPKRRIKQSMVLRNSLRQKTTKTQIHL